MTERCECLRPGRITDDVLPYRRTIAPYDMDGWLANRDCTLCAGSGWFTKLVMRRCGHQEVQDPRDRSNPEEAAKKLCLVCWNATVTEPEIPKEDPVIWGPKEGTPAGLEELDGSGFWVPCEELGWPLDTLGKDAAVYLLPVSSLPFKTALREALGGQDPETPEGWIAAETALPAAFARHVMTGMRGIRLQAGGPILEDTPENRELALRTSSILLDRVHNAAHEGPSGDTWREHAIRYRHALGEVSALVTSGMIQGVHPAHILRQVHGRVNSAMGGAGMVMIPMMSIPAPQAPEGEDDEGGGGQAN